jgi:hypothetical protein
MIAQPPTSSTAARSGTALKRCMSLPEEGRMRRSRGASEPPDDARQIPSARESSLARSTEHMSRMSP